MSSAIDKILSSRLNKSTSDNSPPPHLVIEARAGTGKTTTLIEGLKYMRGQVPKIQPTEQQQAIWEQLKLSSSAGSVCFVAFNKSIADELAERVPSGVQACTMHSMGMKAVTQAFGRIRVNQYRIDDLIERLTGTPIRDLRREFPTAVSATKRLVGLCKMNLVGLGSAPSVDDLNDLAAYYNVDMNGSQELIHAWVPQLLARCLDVRGDYCMDFDDMIWLPVALKLPVFRFDLLLVDEAQDLNRCQQSLAKAAGRRLVLCGDPKQAIYGFAGADAESMPRMIKELSKISCIGSGTNNCECQGCVENRRQGLASCVVLPLTVTRRCGKKIVAEAQKIVPDFQAWETNPEGAISEAKYPVQKTKSGTKELSWDKSYGCLVREGDMVLCRVNANLVSQCFRFLKRNIKATIQGRDIGQGLISTVTKQKAANLDELTVKLETWLQVETAKENSKRNPSEERLIALADRLDCLNVFISAVRDESSEENPATVEKLISRIESIFTDNKQAPGVRLSSIHKAKGLEADRVFLLRPKGAECPHPMAKSDWERGQELNLLYVAITRAIHELIYVS